MLKNNQYGYRDKHSIINVITVFASDVINALLKGLILSVFLNLRNAFDTINQHIVLYKLDYY